MFSRSETAKRTAGIFIILLLASPALAQMEKPRLEFKHRRGGGGGGSGPPVLGDFTRHYDHTFDGQTWECGQYVRYGVGGPYPACQLKGGKFTAMIALIYRQDNDMKILYAGDAAVYDAPKCNADCPVHGLTHGTTCFYVPDATFNWETAQAYCAQDGGQLAIITSDQENQVVNNLFIQSGARSSHAGMWIGASAPTDNHDDWRWVDGTSMANGFTSWASPAEPNNFGGNEFCAEYYYKAEQWNDDNCEKEQPYACSRPTRHEYCSVIEFVQNA